jgi:hypothetical protein
LNWDTLKREDADEQHEDRGDERHGKRVARQSSELFDLVGISSYG